MPRRYFLILLVIVALVTAAAYLYFTYRQGSVRAAQVFAWQVWLATHGGWVSQQNCPAAPQAAQVPAWQRRPAPHVGEVAQHASPA